MLPWTNQAQTRQLEAVTCRCCVAPAPQSQVPSSMGQTAIRQPEAFSKTHLEKDDNSTGGHDQHHMWPEPCRSIQAAETTPVIFLARFRRVPKHWARSVTPTAPRASMMLKVWLSFSRWSYCGREQICYSHMLRQHTIVISKATLPSTSYMMTSEACRMGSRSPCCQSKEAEDATCMLVSIHRRQVWGLSAGS